MNYEILSAAWHRQLGSVVTEFHDGLREVSGKEHSPSRVHQLRVALRRLEAALFLCEPGLRRSERRWFERCCRRLRETSNTMRDCDVVLKWIDKQSGTEDLQARIQDRKSRAGRRLRPLVSRLLQEDKITKHGLRLAKSQPTDLAGGLASRLLELNGLCMNLASHAVNAECAHHRWRISCKKLRYSLDFMVGLGCGVDLVQPLADLKLLQEELGTASDKATIRRFVVELREDLAERLNDVSINLAWANDRFSSGVTGSFAAVSWCLRIGVDNMVELVTAASSH